MAITDKVYFKTRIKLLTQQIKISRSLEKLLEEQRKIKKNSEHNGTAQGEADIEIKNLVDSIGVNSSKELSKELRKYRKLLNV